MKLAPPSRQGLGYAICDRTGAPVPAEERIKDVRGGMVRRQSADQTSGFGTRHPIDVRRVPITPDPRPIRDARPEEAEIWAEDLGTDQERERALRERP